MKIKKYLVIKDFYMKHGNMEILHKKGELVNSTHITALTHMRYLQPLSSAKWAIKLISREITDYISKRNLWKYGDMVFQKGITNRKYFTSDGEYSECLQDGYTEIDFETFKEITGMGEENEIKQVVQCSNIEECEKVLEILNQNKPNLWFRKEHLVEAKDMCFEIKPGFSYSNLTFYQSAGYTIIPAEQFIEENSPKIFTLEDVRNGKCAIDFDDMLQLPLKRILTLCFPDDNTHPNYNHRYFYSFNAGMSEEFDSGMVTDLPTQSVKLFLSQIQDKPTEEWQPKWGDEVEASDDGRDWIVGYVYCCPHPLYKGEHLITRVMPNNTARYKMVRKPLEIHEFTTEQAKQDIAKLHNLNVNQIKIVE